MIKMIVTDIDGTILGKRLKVSENVKKCFQELIKKNIKIVLATGRMYLATEPLAQEIGLIDPVICYQGGYIREITQNKTILRQILIDQTTTRKIIEEIKKEKIHINLYADDKLFVEEDNEIIKNYCKDRFIPYKFVENLNELNYEGFHKILAIDNDAEKINYLIKNLTKKYGNELYITHSSPQFCEVSNLKANKGNAIKFLAEKWGIKKEEILACGDQNNDIEMLNCVGTKIAMGNASESLKNIADFVTDDVENDGICKAIEKYITT